MNGDLQKQVDQLRRDFEALNNEFYRNNFSSSQDFNKYSRFNTRLKVPVVSSLPSACEIGEVVFNTGTSKFYVCSAANTWTAQT